MPAQLAIAPLARRRVAPRVAMLAVLAGAVAGVVVAVAIVALSPARSGAALPLPELHGQAVWAAGDRPAPRLSLADRQGRLVSLRALRGQTLILTFMPGRCGTCPAAARQLDWTIRRLPALLRPVVLVVGAGRPAVGGLGAGWHWLRATGAQEAAAESALGLRPGADGSSRRPALFLIDSRGFERAAYLFPFLPAFVDGDLRTLARSGA